MKTLSKIYGYAVVLFIFLFTYFIIQQIIFSLNYNGRMDLVGLFIGITIVLIIILPIGIYHIKKTSFSTKDKVALLFYIISFLILISGIYPITSCGINFIPEMNECSEKGQLSYILIMFLSLIPTTIFYITGLIISSLKK